MRKDELCTIYGMLLMRYNSGIKDKLYNSFKVDFQNQKKEQSEYNDNVYFDSALIAALSCLSQGMGAKSVITENGQIAYETDLDSIAGMVVSIMIVKLGYSKVLEEKEHFMTFSSVIVNMTVNLISIIQSYFDNEAISNSNG